MPSRMCSWYASATSGGFSRLPSRSFQGVPDVLAVAERRVEHPPLAVLAGPGDRVVPRLLGVGVLVHVQEVRGPSTVVILEQVNLLEQVQRLAEPGVRGMRAGRR